jgi:hypothetical protein
MGIGTGSGSPKTAGQDNQEISKGESMETNDMIATQKYEAWSHPSPAKTSRRKKIAAALACGAVIATGAVLAPAAHADRLPPNCESHPWGFLGLTKRRIICDGPIQPDGSWMRERVIGVPGHYEYPSSSCSIGSYYSHCTYYPGGWVDAQFDDDETYPVRPDTVLPDEPGHLG